MQDNLGKVIEREAKIEELGEKSRKAWLCSMIS